MPETRFYPMTRRCHYKKCRRVYWAYSLRDIYCSNECHGAEHDSRPHTEARYQRAICRTPARPIITDENHRRI